MISAEFSEMDGMGKRIGGSGRRRAQDVVRVNFAFEASRRRAQTVLTVLAECSYDKLAGS